MARFFYIFTPAGSKAAGHSRGSLQAGKPIIVVNHCLKPLVTGVDALGCRYSKTVLLVLDAVNYIF